MNVGKVALDHANFLSQAVHLSKVSVYVATLSALKGGTKLVDTHVFSFLLRNVASYFRHQKGCIISAGKHHSV